MRTKYYVLTSFLGILCCSNIFAHTEGEEGHQHEAKQRVYPKPEGRLDLRNPEHAAWFRTSRKVYPKPEGKLDIRNPEHYAWFRYNNGEVLDIEGLDNEQLVDLIALSTHSQSGAIKKLDIGVFDVLIENLNDQTYKNKGTLIGLAASKYKLFGKDLSEKETTKLVNAIVNETEKMEPPSLGASLSNLKAFHHPKIKELTENFIAHEDGWTRRIANELLEVQLSNPSKLIQQYPQNDFRPPKANTAQTTENSATSSKTTSPTWGLTALLLLAGAFGFWWAKLRRS